jgi:hypothetical protein
VLRRDAREHLRQYFSDRTASFVITCQDPALIADLLPTNAVTLELTAAPLEVSR